MKKIATYIFFLAMAATSLSFAQAPPAHKVYLIIDISIKDSASYAKYVEQVPPIIKKYGGRYLARGGKVTPMAGNWNPERVIVIEFASKQQLQECFQSQEYKKIAPLRKRATTSRAIAVNGIDPLKVTAHRAPNLLCYRPVHIPMYSSQDDALHLRPPVNSYTDGG